LTFGGQKLTTTQQDWPFPMCPLACSDSNRQ
jgi:hypothetical protein